MKRIIYILIVLPFIISAQDVEFSQFYSSGIYLNPALTGYKGDNCITSVYRNQWPSIPKSYNTQFVGYEKRIKKYNMGLGGYVLNDIAGEGSLKRQSFTLVYSKQLRLSKKIYASFGLKGGYVINTINWNNLTWGDMIDARKGFVYSTNQPRNLMNSNYFDAGVGGIVYTEKLYAGFAMEHINHPGDKLLSLYENHFIPVRYKVHLGGKFKLSPYPNRPSVYMSPQLIYTRQNKSQQFTYGSYFIFKNVIAGLLFRQKESVIFLTGVQKDHFRVAYSYDLGVTRLMNRSGGAHELSFGYIINSPDQFKKKKFKTLSCPLF